MKGNVSSDTRHLAPGEVLTGRKVRLRLPRPDELPFIRILWGDPETMAPVGGTIDFPEARAREWFARMVDPGGPSDCYCLVFDRDDVPVGEISFHKWDPVQRSAELNVKTLATRRRQGLAGDALRAFLAFFFGPVGGALMVDEVAPANRAGLELLRSAGFQQHEGTSTFCRMTLTRSSYLQHCDGSR
jgi:RimJ/RimL family protein N-acetyltransferase